MLRIDIISCVPSLLDSPFGHSILKRAIDNNLVQIHVHDLREYGIGNYRQIDDYQYGGGAGMVLMPGPLSQSIDDLKSRVPYGEIIYLTPDGDLLDQGMSNALSLEKNLLFICGHYKGIDQRIRDIYITKEVSIGDYVLSGGELAAAVMVDSIVRLLPGVMNDETSALTDSFQDNLLAPPVYTRPAIFQDTHVPEILLSGHQAKIDQWRYDQSVKRTEERRPNILED